jgi:LacI family transcriptional regulator
LPVFEKMFEGAAKRAASLGYKLEAFWLKEPGMTARRFHTILHTRAIGGLIIAPVPTAGGHLSLDWSQFAAVALGYSLYRPNLDRVVSHTYHAMLLALRQLKRLGYRRVGLVLDETVNKRTDQNLMAGYYVFQRSLRPSDRVPILVVKRLNASHFARWFERCRPEAVISDDRQALDWLHTLRQSVPSQVGFVTLDRRGPLRHAAGIDLRPELLGEGAVDLLTAKLHRHERGIPPTPKVVLIECQWVDGDTLRVMPRSQS